MINQPVPANFMRPITLRRFDPGVYTDGVWVEGGATDTIIQAAVQPLTAGDYRRLPEGDSGQRGWKIWYNGDFEFGEDGIQSPDQTQVDGKWYYLANKGDWSANGHSEGLFLEVKV